MDKKKSPLELLEEVRKKAQGKHFLVSNDFSNKFSSVAAHYRCSPEEIEEMKALVQKDYEGAKLSYSAMNRDIKNEQ